MAAPGRRAAGVRTKTHQPGFTFVGLMFVVVLLSLMATMASVLWSIEQQREDERELVFAGRQFQAAIERFRLAHIANPMPYPRRLEDLLGDDRVLRPQRSLRQIYVDPMTRGREWGLIELSAGGIVGVYSRSGREPLQRSTMPSGVKFADAETYRDWKFIASSAADQGAAADTAQPASPLAARPAAFTPASGAAAEPAVAPAAAEDRSQPIVRVPSPAAEDYRTRTPEGCSRIAAYDEQVCSRQAAPLGADAALSCQDAALKRELACRLGNAPIPPLTWRRE